MRPMRVGECLVHIYISPTRKCFCKRRTVFLFSFPKSQILKKKNIAGSIETAVRAGAEGIRNKNNPPPKNMLETALERTKREAAHAAPLGAPEMRKNTNATSFFLKKMYYFY